LNTLHDSWSNLHCLTSSVGICRGLLGSPLLRQGHGQSGLEQVLLTPCISCSAEKCLPAHSLSACYVVFYSRECTLGSVFMTTPHLHLWKPPLGWS
jgi:hypothetical protein